MSMVLYARTVFKYLTPILRPGDSVALDEPPGGEIGVPLTARGRISVKFQKRLALPLRLRSRRFDVLHIVDSDYSAAIPEGKLQRSVVTCHDLMPMLQQESGVWGGLSLAGRLFFRQSMRKMARCACVLSVSRFSRDCILKYTDTPENRILVVYEGVDHHRFRPGAEDDPIREAFRRQHGLTGKRVVLHIGAGVWYKNVETVLHVMRELINRGCSDAVLLKIGRFSPEQEALCARLGLQDRVVLLPKVTDEETVLAYQASDLLLWPSLYEGFGICVLEAMACATPVVCSNGGSLPEVAGDAGVVHDPQDVPGLAASCLQVLEDQAFANTLRDKGLARAAGFRRENTVATYYSAYTRVNDGCA
jgi:glycosyltransferase involved in cell wall biosynthesis